MESSFERQRLRRLRLRRRNTVRVECLSENDTELLKRANEHAYY